MTHLQTVVVNIDETHEFQYHTKHGIVIIVHIPPEYPFKPPLIYQSNKKQLYLNICIPNVVPRQCIDIYQQTYKLKCMSRKCRAPFAPSNWGPCYTLRKIIDWIEQVEDEWMHVFSLWVKMLKLFSSFPLEVEQMIISYLLP